MIEKIKSEYFLKKIFFLIDTRTKYKIAKYNKRLQNKLDSKFIDYILFSGRYIIKQSNGIIQEYDIKTNHLLYEGEYKKGQKNGKGKEYYEYNKIKFEGEYLKGKKNGKGKEYYDNGFLLFEGEYSDGYRNGKGKEYYFNGRMLFEGEYLEGKRWTGKIYEKFNIEKKTYELKNGNGYIKEYDYYNGGLLFEGEYLNGFRNGKGREYYDYSGGTKLIYEGEYLNGYRNGKGKEYDSYTGNLIFEGMFKNGLNWTGKGYDGSNNVVYELKNGTGYLRRFSNNHLFLEGELLYGYLVGKCKRYNETSGKLEIEGDFIYEKENYQGKKYHDGKLIFEGELYYSTKVKGKEYNNKGELIFEGEFYNNTKRKGKEFINGRLEYEGEYIFNKKNSGKGYDKNGNIMK